MERVEPALVPRAGVGGVDGGVAELLGLRGGAAAGGGAGGERGGEGGEVQAELALDEDEGGGGAPLGGREGGVG